MISVLIPIESSDFPKVPQCLRNIKAQTVQPDEVMIAILDKDMEPPLEHWNNICKVTIGKKSLEECKGNIVIMLAVGSEYHSKKIEFTRDVFLQFPDTKLLVHAHGTELGTEDYVRIKNKVSPDLTFYPIPPAPRWNSPEELQEILRSRRVPICHGHSAFSKSVFEPDQTFDRGLDVKYCRRLLFCHGSENVREIENVLQVSSPYFH